jgi:hypothetical protein
MRDYITNTVAAAAVASPWWLEQLREFSTLAALLLPIAGLIWLGVQIWSKLLRGK